jgi:hypothetical protein
MFDYYLYTSLLCLALTIQTVCFRIRLFAPVASLTGMFVTQLRPKVSAGLLSICLPEKSRY